jgi:hypothetical protein
MGAIMSELGMGVFFFLDFFILSCGASSRGGTRDLLLSLIFIVGVSERRRAECRSVGKRSVRKKEAAGAEPRAANF